MNLDSLIRALRGFAGGLLLTAFLVAATGCGDSGETPAQRMADAEQAYADGELRTAIIELKGLLQAEPDHAPARRLLGRVYLDASDPASAAKEFSRAIELGVAREEVVVGLARAYLEQGMNRRLLEQIGVESGWPAATRADVHALRARAHMALGEHKAAAGALDRSREAAAGRLQERLARTRLAFVQGATAEAARQAESMTEAYPDSPEAWTLLGRVALAENRREAAETALGRAIELAHRGVRVRLLRARLRIARGAIDEAREDIDAAAGLVGGDHPRVQFARGLASWAEDDRTAACETMQEVVSAAPEFAEARFYLGACQYARGDYNQAQSNLQFAYTASPTPQVARLLSATHVSLGEYDRARELLRPVLEQFPEEPATLGLMARIEMASGNSADAVEYYRRLAEVRPNDPDVRLQLGAGLLQIGETASGQAAFGDALSIDPKEERAGAMLVLSQAREGAYEEALGTAEEMARASPEAALPWTLAGLVHLRRDDVEAAREAFAKAVEREPADAAARHYLAGLAALDGDIDGAREHYGLVLEAKPEHAGTLMRLASLEASAGNAARAGELLRRAHAAEPSATLPRVLFARYKLAEGDPAAALELIEGPGTAMPRTAQALEVAGRAQLALNQPGRAIESFRGLVEVAPDSAQARFLLARAEAAAGDRAAVGRTLEELLARDPDDARALMMLARVRLLQGRGDEARALVERVPEDHASSPSFLSLRAQLAMQAGDHQQAVALYRRVFEQAPTTSRVVELARAQRASGDVGGARATLEEWVGEQTADARAWFLLGDLRLIEGDDRAATEAYREVLARGESAEAMNNLAWLLRSSKPAEALDLARSAAKLQPDNPAILDTLGMVLLAQDRPGEAVEQLRKAVEQAPDAPVLRYHLARALAASDRDDEARVELRQALDGGRFAARDEAQALLEQLGSR